MERLFTVWCFFCSFLPSRCAFFHSNQEIAQVNGMKVMEPFRDCVCGCEKWLKPHADREDITTFLDWSYCSETLELLLFLSGTTYDCCWLDWKFSKCELQAMEMKWDGPISCWNDLQLFFFFFNSKYPSYFICISINNLKFLN